MSGSNSVIVENMTIVGSSSINSGGSGGVRGIIGPHTTANRWKLNGVNFHNFAGGQVTL